MGFFDSFNNSYNKAYGEKSKSTEFLINQKENKERAEIAEREEVENMNDGMLLQKYKSAWTSVRKKELIEQELYSRGYRKTNNGNLDKR